MAQLSRGRETQAEGPGVGQEGAAADGELLQIKAEGPGARRAHLQAQKDRRKYNLRQPGQAAHRGGQTAAT